VPAIFTLTLFAIIAFLFGIDTSLIKSTLGINTENKQMYQDVFLFCIILIGVIFGFLKHNYKPAKIFMGDTGSVFIGANIAIISLMLKQEFLLFLCGMIFVIETATSLIQIYCIRTGRKRLFKMCPIHHHFEFYGWSEKKIVFSFWGISFFFFVISLLIFIKSYTNI
jgi:phospho-N-acetylmuramoyl-pentapeptide-transferase